MFDLHRNAVRLPPESTGSLTTLLEPVFREAVPDVVVVYADSDTTLAAAIAVAKLSIPVAHAEPGPRSGNRKMSEEVNRVLVDHLSNYNFCPTQQAASNLAGEGVAQGVFVVGDLMLDSIRDVLARADASSILGAHGVAARGYYFAGVHLPVNVLSRDSMGAIAEAFLELDRAVLWPLHPRTRVQLAKYGLLQALLGSDRVRVLDSVSYATSAVLLSSAKAVLTDSGGMQEEGYFSGIPCVTLRNETEWVETVELGRNTLAGTSADAIVRAAREARTGGERPPVYGDGHAAEKCVVALEAAGGVRA